MSTFFSEALYLHWVHVDSPTKFSTKWTPILGLEESYFAFVEHIAGTLVVLAFNRCINL